MIVVQHCINHNTGLIAAGFRSVLRILTRIRLNRRRSVYPPKEENVLYFTSAIECANAEFRPCLRCRPDSAPNSPVWKGVNATLDRAVLGQQVSVGATLSRP